MPANRIFLNQESSRGQRIKLVIMNILFIIKRALPPPSFLIYYCKLFCCPGLSLLSIPVGESRVVRIKFKASTWTMVLFVLTTLVDSLERPALSSRLCLLEIAQFFIIYVSLVAPVIAMMKIS